MVQVGSVPDIETLKEDEGSTHSSPVVLGAHELEARLSKTCAKIY
jgi:hypothetical protein